MSRLGLLLIWLDSLIATSAGHGCIIMMKSTSGRISSPYLTRSYGPFVRNFGATSSLSCASAPVSYGRKKKLALQESWQRELSWIRQLSPLDLRAVLPVISVPT